MQARGDIVGDGVRIHSMALPGLISSVDVRFAGPGEVVQFVNSLLALFFHPIRVVLWFKDSKQAVMWKNADAIFSARCDRREGIDAWVNYGNSEGSAAEG